MRAAGCLCAAMLLAAGVGPARSEVQPQAHYSLKGAGGIRDTACPPVLKDLAGKSPELQRQGSPKVMTDAPECRRQEYDSAIKFEQPDQCYSVARNLVSGDNFVVEAWAYALSANDPGWHTVVANGHGGIGFLLAQCGDQWAVLVGGIGGTNLGKVEPGRWAHLAIVKSAGAATGWLNGVRVCRLPALGGGVPNFSIGATAPGKEPFQGWIAEVRYSTFRPGRFDPAADFLMDTRRLKTMQASETARRRKLIDALLQTPGARAVERFDEMPAAADWLLKPPATHASVQVLPAQDRQSARILLANGLVSRTFLVADGNLACISLRRTDKEIEFVRATKPEVRVRVNGGGWTEIGGLAGAPDRGFLTPAWWGLLESRPGAFRLAGMTVGETVKPYEWQPKCNAPAGISWPAKGVRVTFHFVPPADAPPPLNGLLVDVAYEVYDGLPAMMKTFTLRNNGAQEVLVTQFEGEHLAVQPTNSRLMHVESDYSFAAANGSDLGSGLGIHSSAGDPSLRDYSFGAGTTRFVRDPEWGSMATLNPAEDLFLGNPENALLLSRPSTGPNWPVPPGGQFDAFRTFEILNDTTERERYFLAQRRFYAKLAPQTNEHQLEVHCPTHDLATLKACVDQMSELGFERLQIEYPAGIRYEDISEGNIRWLKEICDYAKARNVRVGAYQLMVASQGRSPEVNCIDPATGRPGSLFGQSTCLATAWGDMYRDNMFKLIEATGLGAFDPDGPYHGDPCASKMHAHHRGLEDSQWAQWRMMCDILHEGQRRGLYLTVPDWYFLNGQACTGMGYREATDNLDIVLQTVLYRQYIYDATFHKTAGMGWVNLNTEVLHGGLEANLDKYERQLFGMLASGAQVWVRGTRLYDGPAGRAMVKKWVAWYRKYRDVIQGDIIHLRRPDGRGLDYYLHVNPAGKPKGMLLLFNPLDEPARRTIEVPLYYTGLTDTARIREQEGPARRYKLGRDYTVSLTVSVPANGWTWYVIE